MVSVILSVFNRKETLKDSLLSVAKQQGNELEIIVIDNGSSENIYSIIEEIDLSIIRYYRLSRNFGQSYARNVGIELARGEIIAFQDSDVIWLPGRLETQLNEMQGYDFSFCDFERRGLRYPNIKVDDDNLYEQILHCPSIGSSTLFCRKDILNEIGRFDENYRFFEGYDLSLRLCKKFRGRYIDKVLYYEKEREYQVREDENANEGMRAYCSLLRKYWTDIVGKGYVEEWISGIKRFKEDCDSVVYEYEIKKIANFIQTAKENSQILNHTNQDYVRNILHEVVDAGIEFKNTAPTFGKGSIEKNTISIQNKGIDINELIYSFKTEISTLCTNFGNTGFMGFPDAGNSVSGLVGAIFSDFMQQNLINESYCAPIATKMEIEVIKTLRNLCGYKEIAQINEISELGGIITYGGTGSNAIAMMMARERKKSRTMYTGIRKPEYFKVIVPKGIGHYSIRSSLRWLGCGDQIIEVETIGYRYNLNALKEVLVKEKENVMAVVAYAGDSRTMTIEYMDKIEQLVHSIEPNIWCHADACHGFSLLFSKKMRGKVKGIEKFDSISFDPHKVLAIPYCISAFLVKEPSSFQMIVSESDLIMNEKLAFGKITPFIGSKSWISLKLWFLMKNLGIEGVGELIEQRYANAQYFKEKLYSTGCFGILNNVDYNAVAFIWKGNQKNLTDEQMNSISRRMYEKIKKEGHYYFHQFPLINDSENLNKGAIYYVLRYMSGNHNLSERDINTAVEYLVEVGRRSENEEFC